MKGINHEKHRAFNTRQSGIVLIMILMLLIPVMLVFAGPINYLSNLFELGPSSLGDTDIVGSAGIPGPDWADIFDAQGNTKADALESYGGIDAIFFADGIV